ncbi:hypothetical protein [Pseudomonas sp. NPDC087615]|uniref:hypothetical protein n=1 Tax=Pseudomonas sp. NPDC087615 TaxID=3364443 RepID=UPI00382A031D
MSEHPSQEWFEMAEVRRRRLSASVWIPLRRSETVVIQGEKNTIGLREEVDCVGSVAVALEHRAIGERLSWSDIGLIKNPGPSAYKNLPYKPADVHWFNDDQPIGVDLVLVHSLNGNHEREWFINQDLIMALRLLKEGDVWLAVDEGYEEVIRRRRDAGGNVVSIDIKSEYLRDYLCARGMALRISQYRQRMALLDDPSYLSWPENGLLVEDDKGRFSSRVFGVDSRGWMTGGSVALMQVWRTDVDEGEDVPIFDGESDENTEYKSSTYTRPDTPYAYRTEGELWREDWIEPADRSTRIRDDDPVEDLAYVVDASGERLPASALDNEDVGRWLWFKPQVIEALLGFRGSSLSWYSKNTGGVKCSPDYDTHFGINAGGYINVYAYDIAKLPQWQQRVWYGHNAAPDGPVSAELMSAQMGKGPADTIAPEARFAELLEELDVTFVKGFGSPLFRPHDVQQDVLSRVHRFRSLAPSGILSLAKDVARLTADSFDIPFLRSVLKLGPKETLGSIKLLQAVLSKAINDEAEARKILGPLVGVYDLRLGDAHLPSSKIDDAYALVGIDRSASAIDQAVGLLDKVCVTFEAINLGIQSAKEGQ